MGFFSGKYLSFYVVNGFMMENICQYNKKIFPVFFVYLGKLYYMAKEIERRFLIDSPIPWDMGEQKLIKQGYVFVAKNKQLRVRIVGDKSFLCLKYTKNISRDEYEYEIPLLDGLEIFGKCTLTLEKIRNTIHPMNHPYVLDIDTYPNGIVVVEVEFKNEDDAHSFVKPDWFGDDITGNGKYSNIELAKQHLRF